MRKFHQTMYLEVPGAMYARVRQNRTPEFEPKLDLIWYLENVSVDTGLVKRCHH